MRYLLFLGLLLSSLAVAPSFDAGLTQEQPGSSSLEQDEKAAAILHRLDELAEAGIRRDADSLSKIYSANYFHTNANGSIMDRAEVLASYKKPTNIMFDSNTRDEYRMQFFGDTAVVSNRITLHGKRGDGAVFTSRFRTTTVLVKQKGVWLVVNSHASFLDEN